MPHHILANALRVLKGPLRILYHIGVIALSAGIALSLPRTVSFLAKQFLVSWALIENEKIFLISVEIAVAGLLILFFNYAGRSWRGRKLAKMARGAGMVYFTPTRGVLARRKIRRLKEKQGVARDVMIIGSTGYRTVVDQKGDLHDVIQRCREARIMLLNPYSEGASARAKSIVDPEITLESLQKQITKSIELLKGLRALQKNVSLKLYPDAPLFKLAVLGDFAWVQHYHAGLDVQMMPEYLFAHDQNPGSLYTPLYQYFLSRWRNPAIPEYDLDTDELVYRDMAGNPVRRETFPGASLPKPPGPAE